MSLAVENNRLVTLWVRMADMTGKTLEESPEEGLTYWHGHGDIFPKIEAALEGRFPGEGFTIHLEPHDAFGEYDCDAIVMTDVANLGDPATVVPGLVFEEVPGVVSDGRLWRVTDVADPDKSDFTPLTAEPMDDAVVLSKVKHGVRVAIDEEGLTAAAYTVMATDTSSAMPPDDIMDFVVDRPFLFAVTDNLGLPLFVGIVNQP